MTVPVSDLAGIRYVADAETPPEVAPYNGVIVGLRPADIASMGSGVDNKGFLFGIYGYSRPLTSPAPPQVTAEWLMCPRVSASTRALFEAIPHPTGWVVAASRTEYRVIGLQMLEGEGIPENTVIDWEQRLYNAARAELQERFRQGLPL